MTTKNLVRMVLICFSAAAVSAAPQEPKEPSGIAIRIHVPFRKVLVTEGRHWGLVRIENRSENTIPVFTNFAADPISFTQFRTEVRGENRSRPQIQLASWDEIKNRAEWAIRPNEAAEMLFASAQGIDLSPNGESRISLQVGPSSVVHSNWVDLQTLPKQDTESWQVVAQGQLTPGETGLSEFLVGSVNSQSWLFERPVWNRQIMHRVCRLPGGVPLVVECDASRSQAIIRFGSDPRGGVRCCIETIGLSGRHVGSAIAACRGRCVTSIPVRSIT